MATGIQTEKLNSTKINMLDYIEKLNELEGKLDDCAVAISSNVEGDISSSIAKKIENIKSQMKVVKENTNSYVDALNKVTTTYEEQDNELSSIIKSNIKKLDNIEEE